MEGRKRGQKGESLRPLSIRSSMGEELTQDNDIKGRWKEYFVQLLNSDEIREVEGDIRGERIGENEIVVREVGKAVLYFSGCV